MQQTTLVALYENSLIVVSRDTVGIGMDEKHWFIYATTTLSDPWSCFSPKGGGGAIRFGHQLVPN